jgi:hypothetical protein
VELIVGAFANAEEGDEIGVGLGPCLIASPGDLCPYCEGWAEEPDAATAVDICVLMDP